MRHKCSTEIPCIFHVHSKSRELNRSTLQNGTVWSITMWFFHFNFRSNNLSSARDDAMPLLCAQCAMDGMCDLPVSRTLISPTTSIPFSFGFSCFSFNLALCIRFCCWHAHAIDGTFSSADIVCVYWIPKVHFGSPILAFTFRSSNSSILACI